MKRLLAYLFIVFGLGLVFNVNANSAKYSYDKDFICFQVIGNGTAFVGTNKSEWVTEADSIENLCSIFVYKDYHPKKYQEITDKWSYLHKPNLGKIPVGEQYIEWMKLKNKKFSKVRHNKKLLKQKTQITKAEPTNIVEELQNLKRLYDDGVFTKSQFEKAKKRLLNIDNTKIVKKEPSKKKKVAKKSDNDWRKNLKVEGTVSEKNKASSKKKIKTNLNVNDYIFYAFEYPNSGTIASFYNSSTNNLNEAILLLKNGECKFGTSIDKLVENLNYESSFDFKCSYRMGGGNNIYATIQNKANISIYPKEMRVKPINSIGKTISRVADPNEILSLAKNYKVSKLIKQIGSDKSKTKIAKAEPSQTQEAVKKIILSGQYEGFSIGKNGKLPVTLNFETSKEGEILGNYKYKAGNKIYGGPLYKGRFIEDGVLKIFWTEGGSNGWFKFNFDDKFAKLDGAWGFIEDNKELAEQGKYSASKISTKITKKPKEEFKPETGDIDNEAPVIEIAEAITVNDSTYEIEGKVIDSSKKLFVEIDGKTIPVKKGKFKIKRFSPVDEQIKIVAIDQWGNKSKPKLVSITIDIQETEFVEKLEELNPSIIRSKSNKNRVALIIGIEKYEQTPAANFANLDAKYFYEYARKGFGVSKSNIKLLIDEDANLVQSISTINKWLPSKIKKNQTELIIFFAGHGLASNNGEELYILPQDSDPDLLSRTALSRTELFEEIIKLSPKSVTMFMDTCYSGISRDEKMLLASARPIRIVADDQEGIPDNFTIFTASKLDQISSGLKEAKHGIFSYYLMKGLEGKADSNNDKKITNGELLAYMDENVSLKASELGRQQNPSLAGDPNKVLINYR